MSLRSTFNRLLLPVLLPTLFSFTSIRAALVLLPLYVLDRGYDPTLAAFVISIRGVGMLCMDVPAGLFVAKLGDKKGMILGHVTAAASLILFASTDNQGIFILSALLSGASFAAMMVARLSYIGIICEPHERGRVIASIASLQRIGGVVGPLGGGVIATLWGYKPALMALATVSTAAALLVLLFCRVQEENTSTTEHRQHTFFATIRAHRKSFLTAGLGAVGLMGLRGASPLLIALFGAAIELSPAKIGFFVSLATILEFIMFVPAGYIMDHWGRKSTLVPGTLIMALSLIILALFPHFSGYMAGALLMAFGNGLATGVIMNMGADLAPPAYRGQFLGVWRFVCDIGFTGGPLFVTGLMGLVSLGTSSIVLSGLSSCFALIMWFWGPETARHKY
jgi:MFS family permease